MEVYTEIQRRHEKMNRAKVYVAVKADFTENGTMLPREITWEDGTRYEVDCITDIRQAAAMKAGGQGDRYTVMTICRTCFFQRFTKSTIMNNHVPVVLKHSSSDVT